MESAEPVQDAGPVSRPNRMPFGGESISTSSATTMDQGGNQDGDQWFTVYPTLSNQINGFGSLALSAPEESQGLAALPQLMATLDEIWRGLPPADACHISLQDMGQYLEYIAGATFIGSILDQVLSCAQRLRQIYPSAVTDATTARHATHHAAGTGCTTEDCIHMQPLPPAGSSGTPIDYTAETRQALEMANAVPPSERPQFLLPQLQMGSFVLSQDKTANMLISMFVDQQQSLVEAATQLGPSIRRRIAGNDSLLERMFEVQHTLVMERAGGTLNDFMEMRDAFASVDVFGTDNVV
ncbi:hypothetical protein NQ176_g2176 [Zarea fungicola]|uniref:Uncharacterized protein n=1 Tax=Zarea fungicola TaxID=93591 RepID=A0ACC1NQ27_9HYPO|nr:hypothetical protein NQ176_g2176 [Lecanicillium fungicola]